MFRPAAGFRSTVALRKESVDRNIFTLLLVLILPRSLSARRAWIEIGYFERRLSDRCVALRKESVDRNRDNTGVNLALGVALRKESVDRNLHNRVALIPHQRRSPQGERG